MSHALRSLGYRNVQGFMFREFGQLTDNSSTWIPMVAGAVRSSNQPEETYMGVSSVPSVRRRQSRRAPAHLVAEKQVVSNEPFELTLGIDQEDILFDRTSQVQTRIRDLRMAYDLHWEEYTNELISNGRSATLAPAWDGAALFSTSHAGSQANYKANASATSPTAPTGTEFEAALWDAITAIKNIENDAGRKVNRGQNSFVIHYPSTFNKAVAEALNATHLLNGSGDLQPNVMVAARNYQFTLVENDELGFTDEFAMFIPDGKALIRQEVENSFNITSKGAPDSEFYHDTGGQEHGIEVWRGIGVGRWESAYMVQFA